MTRALFAVYLHPGNIKTFHMLTVHMASQKDDFSIRRIIRSPFKIFQTVMAVFFYAVLFLYPQILIL